jgi:hypothetical protein
MSPLPNYCENTMTNEPTPLKPSATGAESPLDALDALEVEVDDEIETTGELHRLAAHHFAAAAKYQLLAATADEEGDRDANARHAHLAYRHQLTAVQYAEIAVMDNENLEGDNEIETH